MHLYLKNMKNFYNGLGEITKFSIKLYSLAFITFFLLSLNAYISDTSVLYFELLSLTRSLLGVGALCTLLADIFEEAHKNKKDLQ